MNGFGRFPFNHIDNEQRKKNAIGMCDTLLGYNVLPLWKFLKNNQLEDKRFPQNRK
jgi:predicted nucleotide-binding protein (sugar kinase/HSP70/actin superfamily)